MTCWRSMSTLLGRKWSCRLLADECARARARTTSGTLITGLDQLHDVVSIVRGNRHGDLPSIFDLMTFFFGKVEWVDVSARSL
jgi:hypothetical protein